MENVVTLYATISKWPAFIPLFLFCALPVDGPDWTLVFPLPSVLGFRVQFAVLYVSHCCHHVWYPIAVRCFKLWCFLIPLTASLLFLLFVYLFFVGSCLVQITPKGGRGCLMSPPCLESQGWHVIPLAISSLVLLPNPVTLSILSFSTCWSILLNFFQKILQHFSLRGRLFCMAPV